MRIETKKDYERGTYFCEPFLYGKRLKGDIMVCDKEKIIIYHLYKHKREVLDSGMFVFNDCNKVEKYQQVVTIVRDYLNNCQY